EEDGPILEEGKRYTLTISAEWRDAEGNPLKAPYRRQFRAGPPDDTSPDPANWKQTTPVAGSRERLSLQFPEPLDRAMLDRALALTDGTGHPVPGRTEVPDDARSWRFVPDKPWSSGRYVVVIDTSLEDLAGNSIARPFEVDIQRPIERRIVAETTSLP